MTKIYTKTGDKGKTRLVDGSCVEKFNPRVEAYGNLDELNSYLGLVRSLLEGDSVFNHMNQKMERIQNDLFCIGSLLACESADVAKGLPQVHESDVVELEVEVDHMSLELPVLKNFILPGGSYLISHLHVARTVCRRCERRAVEVWGESPHGEVQLKYLNRLSDYLFIAARWVACKKNIPEIHWKGRQAGG